MTVRDAKPADFPQVYALFERLRDQLPTYPGADLDRRSVVHSFGLCANSQMSKALVAEHAGKLTGVMLGITQELWFSRAKEATDLVLFSERPGDGVAMIRRFVEWAWTVPKVVVVTLSQSSGIETARSVRVLEHMGFKQIGGVCQLANPTMRAPVVDMKLARDRLSAGRAIQ